MAADRVAALRSAYEAAFNARRLEALDAVFDAAVVDRSVAKAEEQVGLDGFKRRIAGHHAGVSDLRMELFEVVAQGDLVAFRWAFTGTHDGTWLGRPATNRAFVLSGMNLERFDPASGLVVEHFSYPDLLGLLRQLGFA
jgi:predicted ester cyclase